MGMNKNKFRALALIEVIGNLRKQVWPITLVLTLKAHWSVHLASIKNRLTWHFFVALDLCRPVSANQQKASICKRSKRKGLISQPQAHIHGEWTFVEFAKKACFQFEPWPGSGIKLSRNPPFHVKPQGFYPTTSETWGATRNHWWPMVKIFEVRLPTWAFRQPDRPFPRLMCCATHRYHSNSLAIPVPIKWLNLSFKNLNG